MNIRNRKWAYWEYDASVAQVVGVPASIGINFTVQSDNELRILALAQIAGTFGGARTLAITHLDVGNALLRTLITDSLTTGQINYGPGARITPENITGSVPDAIGAIAIPHPIPGGHKLKFAGASLANAEVMRIRLLAQVRRALPIIAKFGAGVAAITVNSSVVL